MAILLRAVTPADESFLLQVYAGTRAAEMALTPWDTAQRDAFLQMQFAAQTQSYWSQYPRSVHQIIEADGRPVGRVWVARRDGNIHILDIALLPESNADIGAQIVADLMREGEAAQQSVSIYLEAFDPAQSVFEQLGFKPVEQTGFHCLMQWQPDIPN